MREKMLVFDMDRTIASLYEVEGWLDDIIARNPRPYIVAEPCYDMDIINTLISILKAQGWRIAITSWLAKNSTNEYDREVRKAKRDWLERYGFQADEIHIVKYGTPKHYVTKKFGGYQILIDDEKPNRDNWTLGDTIDPTINLIQSLRDIIEGTY